MNGDDARLVLAAAAANWDRLGPCLGAGQRERLAALAAVVRAGEEPDSANAVVEAARLLKDALPHEFGNGPSARFVFTGSSGLQSPSVNGFVAEDLAVLLVDGHRMAGPVLGAVRDRLLAAPAADPGELRAHGQDPDAVGLIRLRGTGGRQLLPRFQFDPHLVTRPVVRDINLLLRADNDPWGCADWWLSANAWLGACPASLLGTGQDGLLLDTAHTLTEVD